MVKIIAHRGFGKGPIENTLYAVREALRLGVNGIEIDVQGSSDGEIVVFHDFVVDAKTNGTGAVVELALEELQKLKLSGGLQIPTLRELIELVKGKSDVLVMIEIKPENIEEAVINVIQEANIDNQVVISSYQPSVLRKIQELDAKAQTALIFKSPLADSVQLAGSLGCSMIAPQSQLISQELVKKSRKVGLAVYPWAVNEIEDLQRMMDAGIETIITDEVRKMQQFLHSLS